MRVAELVRARGSVREDDLARAYAARYEVEVPASRLKKEMTRILVEQGYVNAYEVEPTSVGESIKISLKYTEDRDPVIQGMRRISRPGRRRYVGGGEVPRVQSHRMCRDRCSAPGGPRFQPPTATTPCQQTKSRGAGCGLRPNLNSIRA